MSVTNSRSCPAQFGDAKGVVDFMDASVLIGLALMGMIVDKMIVMMKNRGQDLSGKYAVVMFRMARDCRMI